MAWSGTQRDRVREVAGWKASHKSATDYAAGRGYSPQSLLRWAKEYPIPCAITPEVGFLRLEASDTVRAERKAEVGGASMVVSRGFDAELLRSVVDALCPGRDG